MIKIEENIVIETTKIADKFFKKHKYVYDKFITNIRNYYYLKNDNVDIKAMKTYKNTYRMRINDYRVIYILKNEEIIIISVIAVDSRGQIYKKNNMIYL